MKTLALTAKTLLARLKFIKNRSNKVNSDVKVIGRKNVVCIALAVKKLKIGQTPKPRRSLVTKIPHVKYHSFSNYG